MRLGKVFHEIANFRDPPVRHIGHHAADAHVAGMKPLAGRQLANVVNLFPLRKAIEEGGEGA